MCGRSLRRHYGKRRPSGEIFHVKVAHGVFTVIPAEAFDAAACPSTEMGRPRVTIAALADLHRLLFTSFSFRRSFRTAIVQETRREPVQAPLLPRPRQLDLFADATSPSLILRERCEVVALLARLLIETSCLATSEVNGAKDGCHQEHAAVTDVNIGSMDDGVKEQALGVYEDGALLASDLLAGSHSQTDRCR